MPRKKKVETTAEAVAAAEIAAPEAEIKEKKPSRKNAGQKAPAKKAPKETVMVQYAGKEYDLETIKAAVKADYKEKVSGKVKLLDIYIKPEDGMAYYVVNEITGKVQL